MSSEPLCPECGSSMQLRTARRGRNAGGQFYGCSRYPRCKGTLPIQDHLEANKQGAEKNSVEKVNKISLPHNMSARSKFSSHQVCFIESVATSFEVLEALRSSNVSEQILKAFSQWRIDFPQVERSIELTERSKQVLSVCEKILTRGRITLCSPYVEKAVLDLFGVDDGLNYNNLEVNGFIREQLVPEEYWFDSEAEEKFYYGILPEIFEDAFVQWVTPQVEMASLLPWVEGLNISGRVDFLLYNPIMEKPIIIEIDGEQHREMQDEDHQRDNYLQKYGYIVKRYKAEDVVFDPDTIINELKSYVINKQDISTNYLLCKLIQAVKIVSQIQVTIIQAAKYGFLAFKNKSKWNIKIRFEPNDVLANKEIEEICEIAIDDLMQYLGHLCNLYSIPLHMDRPFLFINSNDICEGKDSICIVFDTDLTGDQNTFFIQDVCLPFHIANLVTTTNAAILDKPDEESLFYFLNYLFRKTGFWEGQLDAVLRAFSCKDAILLLPTGGGKSIAFQLASLLLPGRTIVIEPIISLIEDQLDNLSAYGIDRCIGITSLIINPIERATVLNLFSQGEYLMLYIAPERMQTVDFRDALRGLTVHSPINIVVIDEAHCVSEWGHDFRTAYLNIGRISRDYCESQGIVPPLIALTGTASRAVLKDVQRELQIEDFDAIITPNSFDRPELKFRVISCKSSEKFPHLKGYMSRSLPDLFNVTRASLTQVNGKHTYSGLVFCPWVNGEFGVVQVSKQINEELSIPNDYYSGKSPKYHGNEFSWVARKQFVTKAFKYNKSPLLTCTKAFGMGIDKSNIRYTIHYGLPSSIESFYQEAGRAGRDRRDAYCCILASLDDKKRTQELLDPNTKVERIAEIISSTNRIDNDDITRALYFHVQAFKGVQAELEQIKEMLLESFSDYGDKGYITISYEREHRGIAEKCFHRLLLLGIIDDYTIDYSANTFTLNRTGASKEEIIEAFNKYISGYLGSRSQRAVEKAYDYLSLNHFEFVLEMLKLLLDFIYSAIEQGRRRALLEMFLTASDQANDSTIRDRILRYFEATEHSKLIEELLVEPDAGVGRVIDILDNIWSPNEAAEIRGQTSRYLESYPDYPSLLMLRALTEAYTKDKDTDVVKQNFFASVSSALMNYNIEEIKLHSFIARSLIQIDKQNNILAVDILEKLMVDFNSLAFSKTMVKELPENLAASPALHVLASLNVKCLQLINS